MFPLLRSGSAPHEVYLLSLALLYGIIGTIFGSTPRALEETFPIWAKYLWFVGLFIGSATALYGIHRRDEIGLRVERAALRELTILSLLYIIMSLFVAPTTSSTALGLAFIIGFAIANISRARQIRRDLKAAPIIRKAAAIANGSGNNNSSEAN